MVFRTIQVVVLVLVIITAAPMPVEAGPRSLWLNTCQKVLATRDWSTLIPIAEDADVFWVDDATKLAAAKADILEAFDEDPLFSWMTANKRLHRRLIMSMVNHAFIHGGVLTTKSGIGTSLWIDSDKAKTGLFTMFLAGQLQLVPRFGFHTRKILKFDTFNAKTRTQLLQDVGASKDSIYLYLVGIRPTQQGHGVGSSVIRPVLEYADRQQKWVILETQKQGNLALYEHFGFRVRDVHAVPDDAPTTYTMLRIPAVQ